MKKCTRCGAEIADDALWCPKCGVNLSEENACCPRCGQPVNADDDFCGSCGYQLKEQYAQPAQQVVVQERPVEYERPRRPLYIPKGPEDNVLGLVSFVITMVGLFGFLFTSWFGFGFLFIFLCPITLIMSFIALFKQPRTYAIIAFVISLLECIGMLIVLLFFSAIVGAFFSNM